MSTRDVLKDDVFLQVATSISLLGTCDRAKVGAVIVKEGRCITWGYNGAPPGMPHCDENYHGWAHLINQEGPDRRTKQERLDVILSVQGCANSTHAEANALAFAAREGISVEGGTLYVSVSPCQTCSRLLIAAGIREVIYRTEYRDTMGLDLLREAGVQVGYRS